MAKDIRDDLQKTLGGYTMERELTGGGMSRVFVARDTTLDRLVVVKVLAGDLAAGVSGERFARETRVAAKLQQANIVPVLASGTTADGTPYYTMPFVEGESLRSHLAKTGRLPITDAVGILRDVAKALAYAHDHGIVHRDIKPDNVLLSGGTAVVTDFGIAKAITAARKEAVGGTLTQLGTAIGTPAYMAPEQAAGDPDTDYRADLYSLGCLAFELLAGESPFHGRKPHQMMAAHMGETPRNIAELRPDTPQALADLIMRCLAKDASQRPASAAEVSRELASVISTGGMATMPSILLGGPGMLKKALAMYAAAFLIVAVVARAAIIAIGLPDWVFPGALVVMALGLPVILFTAYVAAVNRRVATVTPTFTPGGTPSVTHGTIATLALKATPHVSWRKTAMGGTYAVGGFVALVGGFMTLRALGIGPAGSLFAAGKLKRDQPILVADFSVKGGADSTLAGVVSEALRTDLAQSNAVRLAPTRTITDALRRMRRPETSRLDGPLAREVAQRANIEAVIDGDVTPLGAGFVVTARVVHAATGDALTSFQEIADTPTGLIAAVGKLSRNLRGKIGESLRSVQQSPTLEAVSTASLEALRKYADGVRAVDIEVDLSKAAVLLKEAVAIDSTFAMAWRKLSVAYGNNGFEELSDSAIVRAFRFRDRLTERERYIVEGFYYGSGPGRDRAKAAAAYEAAVASGTLDAAANNLANIYRDRRDFARAESLYRRRIAVDGGPYVANAALASIVLQQGRADEADSIAQATMRRFSNVGGVQGLRYELLYRRGHLDSLIQLMRAGTNSRDAGVRVFSHGDLALIEELQGHLGAAARLQATARALDSARGVPRNAIGPVLGSIESDMWYLDRTATAPGRIDAALARYPLRTVPVNRRPYFRLARMYALAGRPDKARAMLAQYEAEQRDTSIRRFDSNGRKGVESEILRAEGKFAEAIASYRTSTMLPDGPAGDCTACEHVDLGRLFDAAGMPDSVLVHYEAFLVDPFAFKRFVDQGWLAKVRKRLGELYEQRGDRVKAAKYYRDFVEQWKTADPELQPQVAEVRRRLSRLADIETKR